jgi:hypothetical protein
MENTNEQTDQADRGLLVTLARRVYEEQNRRGWSNTKMVNAFPGLGSTKTYQLIREDKLDGLEVERWLAAYRSVVYQIETESRPNAREEELFEELGPVTELHRIFVELAHTSSNRRISIFAAESGCGKSKAVAALCRKMPRRCVTVEADDTWGSSTVSMLGAILDACGYPAGSPSSAVRLEAVKAALRKTRTCLMIDEAHHIGARGLNLVKTLVNATPGEFVLVGIPTLFRNLECAYHLEVKQLVTNRFNERVEFGLERLDVELYMARALAGLKVDAETIKKGAARIHNAARSAGNLCFVAAVCDFITHSYPEDDITADHVAQAVDKELKRRLPRQKRGIQ